MEADTSSGSGISGADLEDADLHGGGTTRQGEEGRAVGCRGVDQLGQAAQHGLQECAVPPTSHGARMYREGLLEHGLSRALAMSLLGRGKVLAIASCDVSHSTSWGESFSQRDNFGDASPRCAATPARAKVQDFRDLWCSWCRTGCSILHVPV